MLVLILGLICVALRIRPFSGACAALLALTLFVVPLKPFMGLPIALIVSLLLIFSSLYFSLLRIKTSSHVSRTDGLIELIVVAVMQQALYLLSIQWPEFHQIGEHIRDFALLSIITAEPLHTPDPWCDSLTLNYYVYWYRLAGILKEFLSLTTAETYWYFMAFAPALLFGTLLRLGRIVGGWSWLWSSVSATLITFGSNLAAIFTVIQRESWWSPSRAISIGITEFPAWSYLLGDLHPHFLSMVLPPIFLLIVSEIPQISTNRIYKIIGLALYLLTCAALTAAANTWDLFGLALLTSLIGLTNFVRLIYEKENKGGSPILISYVFLGVVCLLAILSNLHLQRAPLVLRLLSSETPKTSLTEYLSHWGFPLGLILISVLVLRKKVLKPELSNLITAGALLVLVFVELFYFDDAYGGISERLNTIFKLSYFTWVPLHFGAFLLFARAYKELPLAFRDAGTVATVSITTVILLITFFVWAATSARPVILQQYVMPRREGLSTLDIEIPGSADAIKYLRTLPSHLRVLEWNEPAYSNSSSLCSLSEHHCYLGWQNHLIIQYKNGLNELGRRQEIIRQMYGEDSCENKRAVAEREQIGAVVITPIEQKQFPGISGDSFRCFHEVRTFNTVSVATL